MSARHIVAIDQGTTSTRAIVFDAHGQPVGAAQREHRQILDAPGWVAHDALEIWRNTLAVIEEAAAQAGVSASDVAAVGIANQRETTLVWDRRTGVPVGHALVWQDTRTQPIIDSLSAEGGVDRFVATTGLPLATYFSASKARWILDQRPELAPDAEAGDVVLGTVDSWLVWNLTGGVDGGAHVTDVTNASRTLLMDLRSLEWADEPLRAFGIPKAMLPEIRPSSGDFGVISVDCVLRGVPIAGVLGDQQAAAFGQAAFDEGESKSTYGTGNFLVVNTGERPVWSSHGLLTTVAYQLHGRPPRYALEGSIAVTGSLIQWLRDNLGIIGAAAEVESLAASVADNGDVYFVPAFSGLFAPYWRPDARGAIVGLTHFANRGHFARAALESTAFQTNDVLRAVEADTGVAAAELRVDGGMVHNDLLMSFQADILGIPVVRPAVVETTALGVAFAAGVAVGLWSGLDELRGFWQEGRRWMPSMTDQTRQDMLRGWRAAVDRSLDWASDRAEALGRSQGVLNPAANLALAEASL